MTQILSVALIVISILLITTILMQSRGVGLSATFGGEGNVYRSKRGVEKVISNISIVLSVLFFLVALLIPLWDRITGAITGLFS